MLSKNAAGRRTRQLTGNNWACLSTAGSRRPSVAPAAGSSPPEDDSATSSSGSEADGEAGGGAAGRPGTVEALCGGLAGCQLAASASTDGVLRLWDLRSAAENRCASIPPSPPIPNQKDSCCAHLPSMRDTAPEATAQLAPSLGPRQRVVHHGISATTSPRSPAQTWRNARAFVCVCAWEGGRGGGGGGPHLSYQTDEMHQLRADLPSLPRERRLAELASTDTIGGQRRGSACATRWTCTPARMPASACRPLL